MLNIIIILWLLTMYKRFFICLLSLIISVSAFAAAPPTPKPLPKNPDEIQRYVEEVQDQTNERIDEIIEASQEEEISGKMLGPWNRLSNEIISGFRVLSYIADSKNPICQEEANKAIDKLKLFLYESVMKNKDLYDSLMAYIQKSLQKNDSLTPYEREGIYSLLNSFSAVGFQEKIYAFKSFFSSKERKPYIYLQSPEAVSPMSSDKPLSILTLNTCFMPGDFPYLYGGATLPWQERVKPLAQEVIKTKADVVCLQEVFSEDAFHALYDQLKGEYTYFYGLIGPRFLGLSFQSVGMPSGLFVASKYPIENPEFTLFEDRGFPMNQGFFDFVIKKTPEISGHIYVSHMQSLDEKKFTEVRANQMKQVIEKMEKDLTKSKGSMPFFLCGDLNIPVGSNEPAEELLSSYFYNDYITYPMPINEQNSTCTYYFTNYLLSENKDPKKVDPKFQILDYALLWKSLEPKYALTTTRVSMNDLSKPDSAISDHHGLLSTIEKK